METQQSKVLEFKAFISHFRKMNRIWLELDYKDFECKNCGKIKFTTECCDNPSFDK